MPPEAGQAFAEVWRIALAQAETLARAALTEEQNALFAEQTSLTQERKLWEIALAEAQTSTAEHIGKLNLAEAQLSERQTLIDQLEAQRIDLLGQRDRMHAQVEQHRTDLEALRTEHAAALAHVRVVEDRSHQLVDQARQEVKALQQRVESEQREHSKAVTHLTAQKEELRNAARSAEQAAAHQSGQVAALEATLSQWRSSLSSKRGARKSTSGTKSSGKTKVTKAVRKGQPKTFERSR